MLKLALLLGWFAHFFYPYNIGSPGGGGETLKLRVFQFWINRQQSIYTHCLHCLPLSVILRLYHSTTPLLPGIDPWEEAAYEVCNGISEGYHQGI